MADPAIKLFGKTIPLPDAASDSDPVNDTGTANDKDMCKELTNNEIKDRILDTSGDLDKGEQTSSSCLNSVNDDVHQTSTAQNVNGTSDDPTPEQDQTEADASRQEKVLKKPDKILPCPRCNSLDTKFCYYNNYNVNQPRHFCKNCQRYWTAGGTMRNVPVGAGRRKNKHSASHLRHIMMPSGRLTSALEALDTNHHQAPSHIRPIKGNGTVLNFGPEAPLCESMASVLNLGDQKRNSETVPEEPSCATSAPASNMVENGFPGNHVHNRENGLQRCCNGLSPMHYLHCYPGPPCAYPWDPAWNNGNINSIQWRPPPTSPAFCAPTVPIPFMPPSFWPSGAWNVPWFGPNGSPTLGKHSRDASFQVEEKTEKSLWVPKTLRIDDPNEAAKSSIWATLGIKPDGGGMFRSFQPKAEIKGQKSGNAQVLNANPAALSRSQSFQESM